MIEALVVEGTDGDRVFGPQGLPLVVGGSARCGLRLDGAGSTDEWMLLDIASGQAFVQPGDGREPVRLNDAPLLESRWLCDGDRIRVAQSELICRFEAERVRLASHVVDGASDTLPPLQAVPPARDAGIEPQRFDAAGERSPRSSRRPRLLPTLLTVLFVVLGAVAWYVFTARSVLIETRPAVDELNVDGGLFALPFGDRFLLRPGTYRLRAEKVGYYPLDEVLQVGADRSQAVRFSLDKLPGRVSFSTPGVEGAEIVLNGESAGLTPLPDLEVAAGPSALEVRAPRYLPFETTLEVTGMGQAQILEVVLVPGWAEVSLNSDPPEAVISVDGVEAGTTPAALELMAGRHELRANLPGHEDWSRTVTAIANRPLDLGTVALRKSKAELTLATTPDGALVQLNGVYQGRTPLTLSLAPGESHELTLSRSGYSTIGQTVELQAGEEQSLDLALQAILGTVRFVAEPSDAELWVDGVARGNAPQTLRLSARSHRIEFRKAGYQRYSTTVTPKPGLKQEVVARLLRAGGATGPGGARTTQAPDGQGLMYFGPGRFTMGSSRREQGRRSNETLREVELTRAFYIGSREVDNAQFRKFDPAHRSGVQAGESLDLDLQPVVNITWEQAARYCNWLSEKESLPKAYEVRGARLAAVRPATRGYRLPTEAEWVWAARGGKAGGSNRYPWGTQWPPPSGAGNFADRSVAALLPGTIPGYDDGHTVAAPVGSFASALAGPADMAGNVAEWVQDVYGVYPAGGARERDPLGPVQGGHHVIRGSSWRDGSISELRFSYRDYGGKTRDDVGFRIARYAD